jgi:hypothetical protein
MTSDQAARLAAVIESCQESMIEMAGADVCADTNRMESHIYRALDTARGYAQIMSDEADRAQPADNVFAINGRVAA